MSSYPKLRTMKIRNFRGIRNEISIDLDDIVILVGSNNSGKSTILRAYECAVNNEKLTIDDFTDRTINAAALPQVELHTVVDSDTAPSIKEWCEKISDIEYLVKEVWTWSKAEPPERLGYRVDEKRWAISTDKPKQPWATDNVASSKRSRPHRVSTFDSPETQSDAIKALVNAILEEEIKSFKPEASNSEDFATLFSKFQALKTEFGTASKEKTEAISKDISGIISKVIPNQSFKFTINDSLKEDGFTIYDSSDIDISLGNSNSMFPIVSHGSGARRTLMWAVLKKLADMGYEAKSSTKGKKYEKLKGCESHMLLLDEPEISLHPQAIRDACRVLYSLPLNEKWQVMVTTHSPFFIDLTQDHTTINRVECGSDGENYSVNLFRPDAVALTVDEKENIKLLNMIDPHVLEFFFGGRVLLVEGDTEYTAFNKIKIDMMDAGDDSIKDLLIVRARGKVQISALMKILNHFKKKYFVLHDSDTPKTSSKRKIKKEGAKTTYETIEIVNPAWTNNLKISKNMTEYSEVFASAINFEIAIFGENAVSGKPANALEKMKDPKVYSDVKEVLLSIIDGNPASDGIIKWSQIEELEEAIY